MPAPSRASLEQQRAANAWATARDCSEEFAKLAKGFPALVMNSGLMQALAFLHEKGRKSQHGAHARLEGALCSWLGKRLLISNADFATIIDHLVGADSSAVRDATTEAMAWLRWLRHFAPAAQQHKDA